MRYTRANDEAVGTPGRTACSQVALSLAGREEGDVLPSSYPKPRSDRFSRFCRARGRDQQRNRWTTVDDVWVSADWTSAGAMWTSTRKIALDRGRTDRFSLTHDLDLDL